MSLAVATRRRAQILLATTLTLIAVAAFSRLGLWQLHRAEEKRALITQYDAGRQTTLALTGSRPDDLPRYQQVRVRGRYDPEHQILLDNMPSQHGRPGYHVLTPFALAQGGWLLVDRGWVPQGATLAELPDIAVTSATRELVGRLDLPPRAGVRLAAPPVDPTRPWPRVMSFPDRAALEQALQRSLPKYILLLDPAEPDGYERAWRARFSFGPERHLAYAVQWFALALAVATIYLILMFRRNRKP